MAYYNKFYEMFHPDFESKFNIIYKFFNDHQQPSPLLDNDQPNVKIKIYSITWYIVQQLMEHFKTSNELLNAHTTPWKLVNCCA